MMNRRLAKIINSMIILTLVAGGSDFCRRMAQGQTSRQQTSGSQDAVASPPTTQQGIATPPAEHKVDFATEIQPILRRHCYRCHGPRQQEGGVRLDLRSHAMAQGDSEQPLLVSGDAANSLLFQRLVDPELGELMPRDSKPLATEELQRLRQWIETGAEWPDDAANGKHWSYVPPVRPAVPTVVENGESVAPATLNPIDAFVRTRLRAMGLKPNPPAERSRLLRRVALVLTGLPPTWEEMERFEQDATPQAYERMVDRYLASPRFGEHWARHWLDLARYADSNGFQADQLRDSWAYRDWVIQALNDDLPFDQFVVEQLAGDLLPQATLNQKIATGFHRTVTCNVEAGVHPEENRVNQVVDRVNTTGTVFLGTTLECCQCHDHKYDPFSQRDYYQLFAYFNNTPLEVKQTSGVTYDFVGPVLELPYSPEDQRRVDQLQQQLSLLEQQQRALTADQDTGFERWLTRMREVARTHRLEERAARLAEFHVRGGEEFEQLEDHSVLISGTVPDTAEYTLRIEGPVQDLLGFKLHALTHPSLPGKGPGRGDAQRTNFILSEVVATLESAQGATRKLELEHPLADFSQNKWDVAQAIDGDPKTGWAISPKFHQPHWASFRLVEPLQLAAGDSLVVRLDQNYGRGRVLGRVRLDLMLGDARLADLTPEVLELLRADQLTDQQRKQLRTGFDTANPQWKKLKGERERLQRQLAQIKRPTTLVMVEQETPRETFILNRGNYLDPGERVLPDVPSLITAATDDLPPTRLGFARWLVHPEHPLLARVTVNRWWAEIFGRGIVATPEDFGTQGEPPTHPQLLDWLARELVRPADGQSPAWSMKHLLKQIVMSRTFQQSAAASRQQIEIDPANHWLARGPRYRLPAESIRDHGLAVSGLLSTRMFGEPVMPYQPGNVWRSIGRNQPKWETATSDDRYRRGIYVVWKRAAPYPSFMNFDAPDRAACTVDRPTTNTPLQALTLLNDPAYAEMAVALAQRMMLRARSDTPRETIRVGFRLATSRWPSQDEVETLQSLFQSELEAVKSAPELVEQRLENLLPRLRDEQLNREALAAWFLVANVLLNLDEALNL